MSGKQVVSKMKILSQKEDSDCIEFRIKYDPLNPSDQAELAIWAIPYFKEARKVKMTLVGDYGLSCDAILKTDGSLHIIRDYKGNYRN
jgi:hypothetical protein